MKIAYLSSSFSGKQGGAEFHVRRLAEELCLRGHQVTIITAESSEPASSEWPFKVIRLPRNLRRERWIQKILGLAQVRGFYRFSQWLFRSGSMKLLGSGPYCPDVADPKLYDHYDVITLFRVYSPWTVLFARAVPKLRGKVCVAVPLFHFMEEAAQYPIHKKLHKDYSLIITNTPYEADVLAKRGWASDKLVPVGVGSDPYPEEISADAFRKKYEIPAADPLVLFVGRKIYNKGVVQVIKAMDVVRAVYPNAWLALIGFSHNDKKWIQQYLTESKYEGVKKTLDLDDVSDRLREEALAACDVMAAPSISESFGIVYLDAWRYKKPVIACKNTCCESFIKDGYNGLLVSFGDVGELGNAMLNLINDKELASRLGENGFNLWSSEYRWQHMADKTEKLYLNLVR